MEKKERNKRIGIIAAMVALIILIMCLGGNTFAKYISSKEVPTTSATVAKWGYTVEANADDLFADAYKNGTKQTYVAPTKPDSNPEYPNEVGAVGVDVNAKAAGSLLVAPGTKGYVTFGVSGSAEVMSTIKIVAKTTKDVSVTVSGGTTDTYHPLKWKLEVAGADGTTYSVVDNPDAATETTVPKLENLDLATMVDKINKLHNGSAKINPDTNVSYKYKLSWEWVFEDASDPKYDKYDTLLSAAAADPTNNATHTEPAAVDGGTATTYVMTTEVDLSIKVTVQQIQDQTSLPIA